MRLLVVGAGGRTGRILTRMALDAGHTVTALFRDPPSGEPLDARLRIVQGDVLMPQTLTAAVAGQDVIVSVVAPRPRRDGRVYVEGTRNLADAAVAARVRRLVVVSAEGAGVSAKVLPLGYRIVLHIPVIARLYPDIAQMERDLMAHDDLDWTIVRAAILTNGPATGKYRVAVGEAVSGGLHIARADLAGFLLTVAESGSYVHERVAIAR